jgi:hypothetical protein
MIGIPPLFWVDGSKKKRLIVNVGSFAGFAPTPVYSLFDCVDSSSLPRILAQRHSLQHGLTPPNMNSHQKMSSFNISVFSFNVYLMVDAYLVTTKLAKIRRPNIITPTEDAFVKAALNNIGRDSSPYWSHMYNPCKSL